MKLIGILTNHHLPSARLFNCARCHAQCCICSHCDRGNIYCSPECSQKSRQESLKKAARRYQNSFKGRQNNAERQRRYREEDSKEVSEKKVTHQGSKPLLLYDLLPKALNKEKKSLSECTDHEIHCDFCGVCCSNFIRSDFLPYLSRKKAAKLEQCSSKWSAAP